MIDMLCKIVILFWFRLDTSFGNLKAILHWIFFFTMYSQHFYMLIVTVLEYV